MERPGAACAPLNNGKADEIKLKQKLVHFVNKREKRFSNGEPSTASFHSRSYHRYFEGYTEITRIQPNGRKKIERIYTGVYHIQALEKGKRLVLLLGYVLLWLACAALFALGAVQPVGSNQSWYTVSFQVVTVAMLFWMLCTLINYITAPKKLTIHDYRTTSGSLKRAGTASAIAAALSALTTLLYLLLHLQDNPSREVLCFVLFLLSSGASYAIARIEKGIPYQEIASEYAPIENGEVID